MAGGPGQATPIDESIPFASVVNTRCQTLDMEAALELRLLEMNDVRERCRLLLARRWEEMAGARSGEGRGSREDVH